MHLKLFRPADRRRHHWRSFTLESGVDQWRRQDLVSGGHDGRGAEGASIEAPKAPSGVGVGYKEGCPLPSRLGSLGSVVSCPIGDRGGAPAAIAFSAYY